MVRAGVGSFIGGNTMFLGLLKGGFLIGYGWAPLGPNLIPYSIDDFLLHFAMYSMYACFLLSGILAAGMGNFLYLHPLLQHSSFVLKCGHM
jgi:hypothetical protein